MGERERCPYCARPNTALSKHGRLSRHTTRHGKTCDASGLTVEEATAKRSFDNTLRGHVRRFSPVPVPNKPAPTVRTMGPEALRECQDEMGGPTLYLRFIDVEPRGGRRWWFVNPGGVQRRDPATVCSCPLPTTNRKTQS